MISISENLGKNIRLRRTRIFGGILYLSVIPKNLTLGFFSLSLVLEDNT